MMKKTTLLLPVLALIAAATAQAQTTNIINSAYGPATIGSGTTSLITNGASITGAITDNGQLLFNRSSSAITNNYAISGAGSVTVASGSTVTLTASNSFAGPLTANNISGANYSAAPTLILSNALGNAIQGNLAVGNATSGTVTVGAYASNQFGSNSVLVFNSLASGGGNAAYFVMHASQTVAGLSGTMGGAGGAIEVNQYGDSANYGSQTLTVNVAAGTNYTLNGGSGGSGNIRNTDNGGSSVLTLVKNGDGIQTLTNINISQTGGTIVNAGSLVVQGSAADSANITVNGGTMKLSGAAAIAAYSGTNVTIGSGATFQLDGFDADSGNGANRSGNAEFGGNSSSGSPLVISGAGTWLITGASSNSVVELGNNSGNSLKINMAQGGLINVASGTLRSGGYSSPDWTSNRASLNVATGAVFELWDGNRPVSVDALTGGGVIGNALGNNDVTLSIGALGGPSGSSTFTGTITDNIKGATGSTTRLTKLGGGLQVLSGNNSYTGETFVNGMLEFATTNSLYNGNTANWTANNITVSNGVLMFGVGGAGQFSTSNITTLLTNGLFKTAGKGFASSQSYLGFDVAGGNFTLTNNLSNSINGSVGLYVTGANTLTITGSNRYNYATVISGGSTLQYGNSLSAVNYSNNYGGINIGNMLGDGFLLVTNGSSVSFGSTIFGGTGSTGTATISSNSTFRSTDIYLGYSSAANGYLNLSGGTTISTNIHIGDGSWSKGSVNVTSGTLSNSGSIFDVGNMGAGTLTISGGTVSAGNGSGTVTLGKTGSNSIYGLPASSGTLNLGNGGSSIGSLLAAEVTGGSGTATVNVNSSGDNTLGQKFSGSLSFNQIGTGTTTLTGSNSYTGTTTISSGTLQVGNGSTNGTLGRGAVVDNSVIAFNRSNGITVTNQISGSGSLIQNGSGTLTLSGSKTYTGGTVINAGTLVTGGNETLADSGAVTVNSGGTFKVGQNETIASLNGAGTVSIARVRYLSLSSGDFSGALNGGGDLYKTGAGDFSLSGTSAGFTGDLYLQGGSVVVGSSTALNANNFVLMSAGSTFTANQNLVLGAIAQNGGTIDGSGVITSISTITRSGALNGVLGDVVGYNSGVLKLGTGTTTLGAANTYTGTTKVSEGTLALGANGSLATNSSAQVASGATLDLAAHNQTLGDAKINGTLVGSGTFTVNGTLSGSGTITPDTVINGTHSPGNSPGIQTFGGNLTYQPGSSMVWQLADNTTNNSPVIHDQILVGKNLTFNGGTTLQLSFNDVGSLVNWTDSLWSTDQSWTIYQVSGVTTGLENLTLADYSSLLDANGNDFGSALAGGSFSISQNGQDVVLTYSVPEPSTYVLFGLGALALVIACRRRRA